MTSTVADQCHEAGSDVAVDQRLRHRSVTIGVGLLALLVYSITLFPVFPVVGDAADYAALVRQGVFDVRTGHIGYYVFAYPFAQLAFLLGIPVVWMLNWLAAVCMAGAVLAAYDLFHSLNLSRVEALVAAAVFATTGIIWYHALFAEVQAMLMVCVIGSYALFCRRHFVWTGLVFALALLVSQAAAPCAPVFLLLAYCRGAWKGLLISAGVGAVAFVIAVAPVAGDYFYGPRGIFPSLEYYQSVPLSRTLALFAYRLAENHTLLLPWVFLGVILAGRWRPETLAFAAVLFVGNAWTARRVGHIEYGFPWMPVYLGTSLLAALGLVWLAGKVQQRPLRYLALVLPLALSAVLSWNDYVAPKRRAAIAHWHALKEVHQHIGDARLFAIPHVGFTYSYLNFPQFANVLHSPWVMMPQSEPAWSEKLSQSAGSYAVTIDIDAHPLRQWIFQQPLIISKLSEQQLQSFRSEMDTGADELRQLPAGWNLELVQRNGDLQLFRILQQD